MMRTTAALLISLAPLSLAAPALAQDVPGAVKPDEPFEELPILTWQDEFELTSTVRQVIFNAYLPLLARPTFYRGVHDDPIPNQMKDWPYQRPDVKAELLAREDVVDRQRRAHAALPNAEIDHLITRKQDFRQEDFERLITSSPRFDDLVIDMHRVQPLGNEWFRTDFDVVTKSAGVVETTKFVSVDIQRQGGTWLLPMKVLLEVAPLARAQAASAAGQPLDAGQFINNFFAVAQKTLADVIPFDLPFLPKTK
ncbi:MAG TPA: hypothetical protein VGO62_10030 [Myxococcota bacterium]|jgi:hypothetical protein